MVATVGATLTSNPKERVTNQPLSFFVIAGAKDPDHPMEAAARSAESVRWLIPYYAVGAAIISIAGAATGVLPGTRERSR